MNPKGIKEDENDANELRSLSVTFINGDDNAAHLSDNTTLETISASISRNNEFHMR